jgi:hypothetical protein
MAMLRLAATSIAYGITGFILTPIVVFFLIIALAYTFDPRCGSPGDSGGCEMGAATIAFASTIPGFVIGVGIALYRGYRSRTPR